MFVCDIFFYFLLCLCFIFYVLFFFFFFFFSSRRRHTRSLRDWSSDVCSSDLTAARFKLPIILIVGNDAGWGLERELQSWATGGAQTVGCELQSAQIGRASCRERV